MFQLLRANDWKVTSTICHGMKRQTRSLFRSFCCTHGNHLWTFSFNMNTRLTRMVGQWKSGTVCGQLLLLFRRQPWGDCQNTERSKYTLSEHCDTRTLRPCLRAPCSATVASRYVLCIKSSTPGGMIWGRYHVGRRPSSDDSLHSPTVIPPSALDKPSIMKRYHRRRTTR